MRISQLVILQGEENTIPLIISYKPTDEEDTLKEWYLRKLFEKYALEIIDEQSIDLTKYGGEITLNDILNDYKTEFIKKLQSEPQIKIAEAVIIESSEMNYNLDKLLLKTKPKSNKKGGKNVKKTKK